jgi:hypothetical protein
VRYLLDNCISPKLAEMLCALGEDVVPLRARFPEDIDDVSLFSQLSGPDLVFLSTDTHQLTRIHEARALKQAKITALFLGPFFGKMKLWQQATWLVTKWPRLKQFAESITQGSCAEIKQNGAGSFFPL